MSPDIFNQLGLTKHQKSTLFKALAQDPEIKEDTQEWFNSMLLKSELQPVQRIYKMEKLTGIYELEEGEEPDTLPERIDMLAEKIDNIKSCSQAAPKPIEEPKEENPLIANTTLTKKAEALTDYLKNKKASWSGKVVVESEEIYTFFKEKIEENLRWPQDLKGYRGAKKSIIERAVELYPDQVQVVKNKSGNKITGIALKPSSKRMDTYGC
jgi:hypothetical protein